METGEMARPLPPPLELNLQLFFLQEARSALHLAAESGSMEISEMLLAKNAYINSKTKVAKQYNKKITKVKKVRIKRAKMSKYYCLQIRKI